MLFLKILSIYPFIFIGKPISLSITSKTSAYKDIKINGTYRLRTFKKKMYSVIS